MISYQQYYWRHARIIGSNRNSRYTHISTINVHTHLENEENLHLFIQKLQ